MTGLRVDDFDFQLPTELIAQQPPAERGQSRMLVMDRATGALRDASFSVLPSLLAPGDLLVLNDSRVIPARLYARRTLRRLNARRVPTQSVPIVFAPEIARSLIGNIFEAANGDSIYRGASFWAHQLGQKVASSNVTVIDDGTLIGLFGTSPFDGEGLPTRRTIIVENGIRPRDASQRE